MRPEVFGLDVVAGRADAFRILALGEGSPLQRQMAPLKKLIQIEFSQDLVKQPLVYQLNRKFDLVINLRAGQWTEEGGFLRLELEGAEEEIQRVFTFLADQGVGVQEVEGD
jgi:ABC-type methionine transport system ATPase subunit